MMTMNTTPATQQRAVSSRVRSLIDRMTLKEKAGQLSQLSSRHADHAAMLDYAASGRLGSLILASTPLAGNEEQQIAKLTELNAIQRAAVDGSRLGIPLLFGRDVIHGQSTIFPIPIGQAATWDPELIEDMAHVSAKEAAASGIHWTFSPMVDISRDPRWGRIAEGLAGRTCGPPP